MTTTFMADKENVAVLESRGSRVLLECLGDNIIVAEDKWRSGYECSECQGECYLNEPCPVCKGEIRDDYVCGACYPKSQQNNPDFIARRGRRLCPRCEGKGALVIAPQESKRRPSSGIVLSVGPEAKYTERGDIIPVHFQLRVGDRVLYTMFAGTVISLKQSGDIRIMHYHEIYCKMWGQGKLEDYIK